MLGGRHNTFDFGDREIAEDDVGLRIKALPTEGAAFFTFRVRDVGVWFAVTDSGPDEIYSDTASVFIPTRVWAIAAPWITKQLSKP